jgi:Protein of unknown function (DUF2568)
MGSHPVNLAVRFILELFALVAMGMWGWNQNDGWLKYVLVIGIPLAATALWGIFAVLNDPSRSGAAPVQTPGFLRLILELGFFTFAVWALFDLEFINLGYVVGFTTALHYIISYDRIMWLLKH